MTTLMIKTATAADTDPVIAVLTLAFSTDPAARWTWSDPQQYLRHFPSIVHVFGGKAFTHGSAYSVDGYAGAALWLPPAVHPDEETLIALFKRTVPEPLHQDLFAVFAQRGRYHPQEPHWYFRSLALTHATRAKGMARRSCNTPSSRATVPTCLPLWNRATRRISRSMNGTGLWYLARFR